MNTPTIAIVAKNSIKATGLSSLLTKESFNIKFFSPQFHFVKHILEFHDTRQLTFIILEQYSKSELEFYHSCINKLASSLNSSTVIISYDDLTLEHAYKAYQKGFIKFLDFDTPINILKEELYQLLQMHADESFYPRGFIEKIIHRGNILGTQCTLTNKERAIIEMIWDGKLNVEIAEELNLSVRTIERYRSEILKRYDAPNLFVVMRKLIGQGALPC